MLRAATTRATRGNAPRVAARCAFRVARTRAHRGLSCSRSFCGSGAGQSDSKSESPLIKSAPDALRDGASVANVADLNAAPPSEAETDGSLVAPQQQGMANDRGKTRKQRKKRKIEWFVSDHGTVKFVEGGSVRTTRGNAHPAGYHVVVLDSLKYRVHRLVAFAFLEADPTRIFVLHKDRNPGNNHVANLEFVTASEHIQHSHDENENRASSASRQSKPVVGWPVDSPDARREFESQNEAARETGCPYRSIWNHLNGAIKNGVKSRKDGAKWAFTHQDPPPDLPGEEWREAVLDGQPTGAEVSNNGRFRTRRGVVYEPKPKRHGYSDVQIAGRSVLVHRLVAETFHGPPPSSQHVVDHINGEKSDNTPENLRWATPSESRQKATWPTSNGNAQPVLARRKGTSEWTREFPSQVSAAGGLGLYQQGISSVLRGECKSTGGWEFVYKEPELSSEEEFKPITQELLEKARLRA